jgi:predicted membrane-bound spermidine synthase
VNGSLAQALEHSSIRRVDYVELDPTVLQLARRYFPEEWPRLEADPRVHVHNMDGRLYIKTTAQKFDVIIVNLPDPQTAQLNRFYTAEFFREAVAPIRPRFSKPYVVKVTSNAPVRLRMRPMAMSIFPRAKTGEYIQYFRPAAANARLRSVG